MPHDEIEYNRIGANTDLAADLLSVRLADIYLAADGIMEEVARGMTEDVAKEFIGDTEGLCAELTHDFVEYVCNYLGMPDVVALMILGKVIANMGVTFASSMDKYELMMDIERFGRDDD